MAAVNGQGTVNPARVPDDDVAEHFARALVWYARHERLNGRVVPTELLDVARYILAGSMRQHATNAGDERRADHAERMGNELLTKRETARALALSVRTVERLIASGELVAVRSGRSVRVRRTDLNAYIEARRASFRDSVDLKEGA